MHLGSLLSPIGDFFVNPPYCLFLIGFVCSGAFALVIAAAYC